MNPPGTDAAGNSAPSTTPSVLATARALFSRAKDSKARYWQAETLAAALAAVTGALPWPRAAVSLGLLALALKLAAKAQLSRAKRAFRDAERARRYDFEERCLGWPVPPLVRARIALASSSVDAAARAWMKRDSNYYTAAGAPGADLLLANLSESVFNTEHLMTRMSVRRNGQLILASGGLLVVLVATALSRADGAAVLVLKVLACAVSWLVALDVYGEMRAFRRGAAESAEILCELSVEARQTEVDQRDIFRIMIDYNCLLADLPLVPDDIYTRSAEELTTAWAAYREAEIAKRQAAS